jgi:hypothetical protein
MAAVAQIWSLGAGVEDDGRGLKSGGLVVGVADMAGAAWQI